MLLLCAILAPRADGPPVQWDLGGDVKSFFLGSFPYGHFLLPEDPYGQGIVDGRLKLEAGWRSLELVAHHAVTAQAPSSLGFGVANTGVGTSAAQVVDLSWDEGGGDLRVTGRTDRLMLRGEVENVTWTLGRQPITFGKTLFFTPLDLVNPFNPTVIDQEYKPGVDAARVDTYFGMATQITAVGAYAGSWDLDGTVLAAYGQSTFGVWDIGPFVGVIRSDLVLGMATAGSVGPVGLRGEGTWTLPPEDRNEDAFVRVAVGADYRPTTTTTLSTELYLQSNGESEPSEYLTQALGDRYARGELWLLGRSYAALSVAQEIIPIVNANLALIGNLEDASLMLLPGVSWSVGDNSEVSAGAYFGVGERPDVTVESEFGLVPATGYMQMRAYF